MPAAAKRMIKRVIFLTGPIGAGKTTLGRALAQALAGSFIDGDDHAQPNRPWYASSLRTSRAIVDAATTGLMRGDHVVVAYPLRCINWIYYRRRFSDAGVALSVINLRASYEQIVHPARGRDFDARERRRIAEMIDQGYGERTFADATVDTGTLPPDAAVAALVATQCL
ncbi:MAG: shikimate kinase [Pseudochelatococcus sp.]|jgi:predicted kinase|uniref:shikimate kinase n=1 Tax=Pseudochelatococcus sp. TaxID=2020869 RepID=UPI003D8CB8A6